MIAPIRFLCLAAFLAGCGPAVPSGSKAARPAEVTDLAAEAVALRTLPGVHSVEIAHRADRPTHRIIHVANWHFVPRDAFAADLRDQDDTISDDKIDRLYAEFLDEVEAVQQEQMALLRALVRRYSLAVIHYEGFTEGSADFKRLVAAVRGFDEIKPKGDTPVERLLLEQHRHDLLQIGAPGRLMLADEFEEVLPIEDDEVLEAANPVGSDGTVQFDPEVNERREDAIVRNLLSAGPVAVVVLGGGHDLSDNVPEDCEYVRVVTKQYRQAVEPERAPW
jgi:hypothetical protein